MEAHNQLQVLDFNLIGYGLKKEIAQQIMD
jgi:hypothetical protein